MADYPLVRFLFANLVLTIQLAVKEQTQAKTLNLFNLP